MPTPRRRNGVADGEIQQVQSRLVQLIDHEADDAVVVLGHHADAVALPQAANEVLFAPGELESLVFDFQNFGHVATNHPANMNAQLAVDSTSCWPPAFVRATLGDVRLSGHSGPDSKFIPPRMPFPPARSHQAAPPPTSAATLGTPLCEAPKGCSTHDSHARVQYQNRLHLPSRTGMGVTSVSWPIFGGSASASRFGLDVTPMLAHQ